MSGSIGIERERDREREFLQGLERDLGVLKAMDYTVALYRAKRKSGGQERETGGCTIETAAGAIHFTYESMPEPADLPKHN